MALYTNMSRSPNMVFRLGYLGALVLPVIENVALFPAIVLCTVGITQNTFAYPVMPSEMYYYVLLSIVFAFLAITSRRTVKVKTLFIVAFLYVVLNDLIFQGHFSQLSTGFFMAILLHICSETDMNSSNKVLPMAFVFISLTLSYWILFHPEARINSYNIVEDMEQVGWIDPNYLGNVLGAGLVVAVCELFQVKRKSYYFLFLLSTIIISVFALLSIASRGAIIAVLCSIVILVSFSKIRLMTKVFFLFFAVIFILYLYSNQYIDFVISRFASDDGTGSQRTLIWESKLSAFLSEGSIINWLFGFGQDGGFKLGSYAHNASTHNDFVSFLIYYGIFGLGLLSYIIVYIIRVSTKRMRPYILAMLLFLLVNSLTIEPLARGKIVYIGLLLYIIQLGEQSRIEQSSSRKV